MTKDRPLLKIHADEQASRRALIRVERDVKIFGFMAFILAVTLVYLTANEIDSRFLPVWLRVFTVLYCLLCTFASWRSYKSIPTFEKLCLELPLLFSFYPHGYIFHLGKQSEQEYSWEHISAVQYSKKHIRLRMRRNPHKANAFMFGLISNTSINHILRHFKTHAPERLSVQIRTYHIIESTQDNNFNGG